MNPPLPLEEAQERLLAGVEPLPTELVPVQQAVGRYLAYPLLAARTQPAADLSAMDGYAVRTDNPAGPWEVIGESAAGRPFGGKLAPGQAIRISTGALMPEGECAVLLQENAAREGRRLALNAEGEPSRRHIRRRGFDFRSGDTLLDAGTQIGPAQAALSLAAGSASLEVHRPASVAILDSGDELASDPTDCAPHQVPASNGAMLAAMAAPFASRVDRIGPVADTLDALLAALEDAAKADVVVTSGGASVGEHDLVRPALERWGASIDFWRVAIRPGKPLLVARKGPQWILGLPGNPVSSHVTAFLFLLPLLRRLAGSASPLPLPIKAQLDADLFAVGERTEFVRAFWRDGRLVPIAERDSSALRSLASADALIVRPAQAPAATAGEWVMAHRLENGGIA